MTYLVFRQVGVAMVLAVLATVVLTPLLMHRYRAGLALWMGRRGAEDGNATGQDPSAAEWVLPAGEPSGGSPFGPGNERLRRIRTVIRARCLAYGLATGAQAILFNALYWLHYREGLSPPAVLAGLLIFLAPSALLVGQNVVVSNLRRLLLAALLLLAGLLLSGRGAGLVILLFRLHLLIPAAILLVFNLRFWRGSAPMVLLVSISGFSGWMLLFTLGEAVLGWRGALLWLLRLLGLAGGVLIGLRSLQWISRMYRRRQLSDQELFLDTWWLLYSIIQALIFIVAQDSLLPGVIILLGFCIFWALKRRLLSFIPDAHLPPVRLLLLRVFGNSLRSERLFEQLRQTWSPLGPIEMIMGCDLALRHVAPADFLAFLTGRLGERFVASTATLRDSLEVETSAFPDGSHATVPILCMANTWHPVMRSLAQRCDAVVMDLRQFNRRRSGCRLELETLNREFADRIVVFIIDASTDLPLLHSILDGSDRRFDPAAGGRWRTVSAKAGGERLVDRLLATILSLPV